MRDTKQASDKVKLVECNKLHLCNVTKNIRINITRLQYANPEETEEEEEKNHDPHESYVLLVSGNWRKRASYEVKLEGRKASLM